MDDINPEQQLSEKIQDCQKTARNLLEEYESLLQKQMPTETRGDTDYSVKQSPLVDDVTKQLMDIDLALESIQQQAQTTLPTFVARSTIQSDDNQKQIAQIVINQQGKLSDGDKGHHEAKLNPTLPEPQAPSNGIFPDDVYLHLLSVMGIQDCLLNHRLVCSLWNDLVLERCHNQKSLKLFENFDRLVNYGELLLAYEKTDDTSLILKSIGDELLFEAIETAVSYEECQVQTEMSTREKKREASKVLTTFFPVVEELVLCPEWHTRINIGHLLQFYAKQLTSLTMTCFEASIGNLFSGLSFPKLKSLTTFVFSLRDDQILSLLPQLESLTMQRANMSLETLLRTGTRLRELNIDYFFSVYTAPEDAFSKRPPINSKLRKFSIHISNDRPEFEFNFISLHLSSLEYLKLDLRFNQINVSHFTSLTSHLVALQQLHSLTLLAPPSFFLLSRNQLAQISPLPSVRQVKLLLRDYTSFPLNSMDRFSRALFRAFPNAERLLIAFDGYYGVDSPIIADFQVFAGKHPNVVQLFQSKYQPKCAALPNAVSPLLGHYRLVYEEYIEEKELFGVAICKLAACLVRRQDEEFPNLKIALRPADRVAAMSNLLQLLERDAFAFTDENVETMLEQMVKCALKYGPSQDALFIVTCKCVLSLLHYKCVADEYDSDEDSDEDSDKETPFLDTLSCQVFCRLFEVILHLVEHFMNQQLNDKELLHQLYKLMVKILTEQFDSIRDDEKFDELNMLKILLKLANDYQTEQLTILDSTEELLLQIHHLIDDQLQKFESEKRLDSVISEFIRSPNRVYRVEMARALLRCCESTDDSFKWLSGEADSDSSEGDSSDSSFISDVISLICGERA